MKPLLLLALALPAYPALVTISDTLYFPNGLPYRGTVTITLNASTSQPLYTSGGRTLTALSKTITVTDGTISIALESNDEITPAGTAYVARYAPATGAAYTEYWRVLISSTNIRGIRSSTVPTPTTLITLGQITPGTNGQVLTTVSGAAAWSNGTTASSSIDFASIPDGACMSNTFTLTGAALGDHLALGVSGTALPDGILATVRVSASNTAQVQVCNLSGAAVDLSSRTYSARIVR